MFKLHVIQAFWGDSLLLEYGDNQSRYILIDGGPRKTYNLHLKRKLEDINANGGHLEIVVLSHVDNDHIEGLLELERDMIEQQATLIPGPIDVKNLWHNSFTHIISGNAGLTTEYNNFERLAMASSATSSTVGNLIKAISEGDELYRLAFNQLRIPVNKGFTNGLILLENAPQLVLDNMTLHILGPTETNLDKLRDDWEEWLGVGDPPTAVDLAALSSSHRVPNLSSIMILAEAGGRKILLTGDGTSDDLILGLETTNLLTPSGSLHVDIMKLPHHGSRHNVTEEFLRRVTASKYVFSASGRYGHPNYETLKYIVEAAHADGRSIEILATNETSKLTEFLNDYDEGTYGYSLTILPETSTTIVIDLVNCTTTFAV